MLRRFHSDVNIKSSLDVFIARPRFAGPAKVRVVHVGYWAGILWSALVFLEMKDPHSSPHGQGRNKNAEEKSEDPSYEALAASAGGSTRRRNYHIGSRMKVEVRRSVLVFALLGSRRNSRCGHGLSDWHGRLRQSRRRFGRRRLFRGSGGKMKKRPALRTNQAQYALNRRGGKRVRASRVGTREARVHGRLF